MGYESYLIEIRLTNKDDRQWFVSELLRRDFSLTKVEQSQYMEKKYPSGIIEICITPARITLRYAKPNLGETLAMFISELTTISRECEITLYDFSTKKELFRDNFMDIVPCFNNSREEFSKFYNVETYPIRSVDVFKKNL